MLLVVLTIIVFTILIFDATILPVQSKLKLAMIMIERIMDIEMENLIISIYDGTLGETCIKALQMKIGNNDSRKN